MNVSGTTTIKLVKEETPNKWTIPLKEAVSLLWDFYRDALRSLTLLSLNVLSKKCKISFLALKSLYF